MSGSLGHRTSRGKSVLWDDQTAGRQWLAVDRHGILYEGGFGQVYKLSPDDEILATWALHGKPCNDSAGDQLSADYLAVDRQGNVYAADSYSNHIIKLSPNGQQLAVWGRC